MDPRCGAALPHPVPAHHGLAGFIARIGEVSVLLMRRAYSITGFFGLVTLTFVDLVRHPRRLRLPARGADGAGRRRRNADRRAPVIPDRRRLRLSGADQLRRFGAEIYTVNLLGIAILRELACC